MPTPTEFPDEPEAETPAGGDQVQPLMQPLWPDTGRQLGFERDQTYRLAATGEIPTRRYGRSLRVPIAWVKRQAEV